MFSRLGSKFLSTTISKDLDEVLTWESRYLGHLRLIITMMMMIYTNIDARRADDDKYTRVMTW